jgi:hypothetical protein
MASLLDDPAYKKLAKDLIKTIERKTAALINKVLLPKDVTDQRHPRCSEATQALLAPNSKQRISPSEARCQHNRCSNLRPGKICGRLT